MLLCPLVTLCLFDRWSIDFVGPITLVAKRFVAKYIITTKNYLTRWDEAVSVKDCNSTMAAKFLFEHVITRFGCP